MAYIYLLASFVFALFWVLIFFVRKDLRGKILWSSGIALLFGFSEALFIPKYWNPAFDVIRLNILNGQVFLESFLFNFFFCGLVAVFWQFLFGQKLFKAKIPIWTIFVAPAVFLIYFIFPKNIQVMHFVVFDLLVGALFQSWFMGNELKKSIFLGALAFSLFYGILFSFVWFFAPGMKESYNLAELSWFRIFGMPLEEFAWVFAFSLWWQPVYEIVVTHWKSGV
jgi:hypothetical protein